MTTPLRARPMPGKITMVLTKVLPFADATSEGLPLGELLRLSLFQVSVGMATILLMGTLNRVMIVELGVPALVVSLMIALPIVSAPFRALLGFRSDTYRSAIGWKRVPYLWFGTLWQFGGLAIMPACLLVLSGQQTYGPWWAGQVLAGAAFLMTGVGMHMTQTAGLSLAADRASDETRPRVVALLYVMFLIGSGVSAIAVGSLLRDFTPLRLIQVVQGCAVVTIVLNVIALWKQEKVRPMSRAERDQPRPKFSAAWADFAAGGAAGRLLLVVALGTMGFNMQDVLLEPYGGQVMGLSVSATTLLTASQAAGALTGFALAARWLARGTAPFRMGARGLIVGFAAFACIILSHPAGSIFLIYFGTALIGLGGGLFSVATLTTAMSLPVQGQAGRGLALGAWGAAQATAMGVSIVIGGIVRDGLNGLALAGRLGPRLAHIATGYDAVYLLEIGLLAATLVAVRPLVRRLDFSTKTATGSRIGLADFPT
ncbi:MAG: PucC family protein [Paracoccaceae bacterium]|nr:PucC family protein [Paracoccaceae bacterium]